MRTKTLDRALVSSSVGVFAVFLIATAALVSRPAAADDCLKVVLGHCLGGTGEAVKTRDLIVSTHEGRVARVERIQESTQLQYTKLLVRLQAKYGAGVNRDSFPPGYEGREHVAVALEKGERVQVWQQDGWTIRLLWVHRGVILRYSHDELEAAMLEGEL